MPSGSAINYPRTPGGVSRYSSTVSNSTRVKKDLNLIVTSPINALLLRKTLLQRVEAARSPDKHSSPLSPPVTLNGEGKPNSDPLQNRSVSSLADERETQKVPVRLKYGPIRISHDNFESRAPLAVKEPSISKRTGSVFHRWKITLPGMIEPFMTFQNAMYGKKYSFPTDGRISSACHKPECTSKTWILYGLFWHYYEKIEVKYCSCPDSLIHTLLRNGLFPSAPSRPNFALSTDILAFFYHLSEEASDPVAALAASLHNYYAMKGYRLTNLVYDTLHDPIRKSLGLTFLWYNTLRAQIEQELEELIARAESYLLLHRRLKDSSLPVILQPVPQVVRLLRLRCPACFGSIKFGRSFEEGGDIHVCVDGNFNHRHVRGVGKTPDFYQPEYIIPKSEVDAVGHRIDSKRKRRKPIKSRVVPDEAVDGCESSHIAGSGSNVKTNMDRYDAGGLMGMVCRHDIPLFAANIDTPGEQQKYAVALIEHLMKLLPPNTNVVVLYDVGCVLDRSINLYEFMDEEISQRVQFATSVLHAYAHQWACQLVYNPRMREGLGLTDGEGVERLWSSMRKLVGITRGSSASRRIFMLDRSMKAIGRDLCTVLGKWINVKAKAMTTQDRRCKADLKEAAVSTQELRHEWANQRKAQLSAHAHVPARLRKELDYIMKLQNKLEHCQKSIKILEKRLESKTNGPPLKTVLKDLRSNEDALKADIAAGYAAVNVHEYYPHVARLNRDFLVTLLLARDLKIIIRRRAIDSFFEWDKLDQAVNGRNPTIGTRSHQNIKQNMLRRKPAVDSLIKKYNIHCETLRKTCKPNWNIHLPKPLPYNLSGMRNSEDLMQDVWINNEEQVPRWLGDAGVRSGIPSLLRADRCAEEQNRLHWEANNLLRWFATEFAAVELALALPEKPYMTSSLYTRRIYLEDLKARWVMPGFVSATQFEEAQKQAEDLVLSYLAGNPERRRVQVYCKDVHAIFGNRKRRDDNGSKGSATFIPIAKQGAGECQEEFDHSDEDENSEEFDGPEEFGNSDEDDNVEEFDGPEEFDHRDESDDDPINLMAEAFLEEESDGYISESSGKGLKMRKTKRGQIDSSKSAVGSESLEFNINLTWVLSDHHREQTRRDLRDTLAQIMPRNSPPSAGGTNNSRSLKLRESQYIDFGPETIQKMRDRSALLDDLCMNGLAQLLQHRLSQYGPISDNVDQCAIFTTYDWTMFTGQGVSGLSDDHMWRCAERLTYWSKTTWIMPIHRPTGDCGHWVVCIVCFRSRELYLFDSFADRLPWITDIQRVMGIVSRLNNLALVQGLIEETVPMTEWVARPALVERRQSGSVDCGLWVLACMIAVLCGYTSTGITQDFMVEFRGLLLEQILSLPEHQ